MPTAPAQSSIITINPRSYLYHFRTLVYVRDRIELGAFSGHVPATEESADFTWVNNIEQDHHEEHENGVEDV